MNDTTIPRLFVDQAARLSRTPLFWVKQHGRYQPVTWAEALDAVRALSAFLLRVPVKAGDRVLLLSENRPEWGIADLAIQSLGAWTVPVYASLTAPDLLTIARDCQPVVCIASTAEQIQKLRALCAEVDSIRLILVMDAVRLESEREQVWTKALEQGRAEQARVEELLTRRLAELNPRHTATLIYTSGTTGEPKGVMLSHHNFLSNAAACLKVIPIRSGDVHLSFLPLSHVFERMAGWYLMLMAGASVAYAETMDTIPQNMLEIRPSIMLGVPRFFEKLYTKIHEGISHAPPAKRAIAQWAMRVGQRAASLRLVQTPLPWGLWLCAAIAERLVFHTLKQRLGGRLRFFVSGSAPLAKAIGEFFYSTGVVILEGYGLTETSPVITVNRLQALKFGGVGLPLEGVEVRIAEDGEILSRGPHIMQGYYHKPQETQAAIVDGWFHTGDIGHLDADGFLFITDRKKDLIKTAGGKFVAPQKLENLFIADPYIAQAFVYGDRERYCVALIVPKFQPLMEHAKTMGLSVGSPRELVQHSAVRQFMWDRVQHLQRELAGFEQVKAMALLDQEFTQASGELTPTLKAKRTAIASRYQHVLQQLYQHPPP